MAEAATISVSGGLTASIHDLVNQYPGVNTNRMGRALVRLGLRQALRDPQMLARELRQLDTPWPGEMAARKEEASTATTSNPVAGSPAQPGGRSRKAQRTGAGT